ncbi:MAG: hypothetical protein LBK00_08005 [Treponema sp.]|jgi:regulator of RNase E activity RraA|nr:hypothetical protein [Treponema sp.]
MDGVLVIPRAAAWEALGIAEERACREDHIRAHIKNRMTIKEILEKEGRW